VKTSRPAPWLYFVLIPTVELTVVDGLLPSLKWRRTLTVELRWLVIVADAKYSWEISRPHASNPFN
jgi:hypothetical protein